MKLSKYTYYLKSIFTLILGVRNPLKVIGLFLRSKAKDLVRIDLRARKISMWVRGRVDAWSVKEAILDDFYEMYGELIEPDWTVVDIGAAIGEFTVLAAKKALRGKVYAFEPNPTSVEILQKNLKQNQIKNVEVIRKGVWCSTTRLSLNLKNDEPLQAVSSPVADVNAEIIEFETTTLQEYLKEACIEEIDLLKSDSEGAEYEVFFSMPASVLRKIKRIVMEYHDLDDQKTHQSLVKYFEENGYLTRLTKNQVHDDIGYLYAERSG